MKRVSKRSERTASPTCDSSRSRTPSARHAAGLSPAPTPDGTTPWTARWLWSPPTYERLIGAWNLDNGEAVSAVQWLIAKVIAAVDDNEPPILSA